MSSTIVAVTGVGLITAAGSTATECWARITAGISGIVPNTLFDTAQLRTDWAGMVGRPLRDDVDRCYALGECAAREALQDADLHPADLGFRAGLVVGSSLGAMSTVEAEHAHFLHTGHLNPVVAANAQLHGVADFLAGEFAIRGPRVVTSNACAASAVAIGYAAELLWHDEVDVVLCGGVDPLATLSSQGFTCLGALDPLPCSPMSASSGLTLGEGAAFLVLERSQFARARRARVLAEVAGYGLTADGYHQTAPDPSGRGASRSIAEALRTAGLAAADVGYINLHGTGTPANDAVEPKAIRAQFGQDMLPPASSTKSMLGHTLGAAGAVEAVCCVLALTTGVLPPTVNTRGITEHHGLDVIADVGRPADIEVALSNSFAFGGNNATVLLTRPGRTPPRPDLPARPVVISGVSALAGSASSSTETLAAVQAGGRLFEAKVLDRLPSLPCGRADFAALSRGINPAKLRRMDPLSVLAAAAAGDLFARYGKLARADAEATGVVFATGYGPVSAVLNFHRGFWTGGAAGADPLTFPNTVVNAAAGHLAMLHRLRGYTATLASGGTSAIAALHLATRVIERGGADRILVVVADEFPPPAVRTVAAFPGYRGAIDDTGIVLSEGAAAILLEAADVAAARGAPRLAVVEGFGEAGVTGGVGRHDPSGTAWCGAIDAALRTAHIPGDQVRHVVSAACGTGIVDHTEQLALRQAGVGAAVRLRFKDVTGETFGSSAAIGLAMALLDTSIGPDQVLVTAQAYGGGYGAMLVRKDF